MSAGDAQRRPADQHARPWDVAGIDGVAQGNVGVIEVANIAHRGESGFQRDLRIVGADQRMRGARKSPSIDSRSWDSCVRWVCASIRPGKTVLSERSMTVAAAVSPPLAPTADDLPVLDDDRLVGQHLAGANVEHVAGVNDGARRRGRGLGEGEPGEEQSAQNLKGVPIIHYQVGLHDKLVVNTLSWQLCAAVRRACRSLAMRASWKRWFSSRRRRLTAKPSTSSTREHLRAAPGRRGPHRASESANPRRGSE